MYMIWIISPKCIPRTIPSWTGFNITIQQHIPVLASYVGYLNSIDSPAIQICQQYCDGRYLTIKEKLHVYGIICVLDRNQSIYYCTPKP